MPEGSIVVTGASGFLGRHLVDALKEDYVVFGIARRSQHRCGVQEHPNIHWIEADIAEPVQIDNAARQITELGGASAIVHLAAYYDFTGADHPEYHRTNVDGLRNVLAMGAQLEIERFVFASSLAACRFPEGGRALNESSPPDGDHAYARSKREGEALLGKFRDAFPSVIVRLAALFSDWCEYPPMFVLLSTWLSQAWNARVLAGRGLSSIPYLHVHDAVSFFRTVLERFGDLQPEEILVASPDEAVSHRELFGTATLAHGGTRQDPVLVPKSLCGPGLWALDGLGRVLGERPFERPWMARYIDAEMRVDGSMTRQLLGWAPRPRLGVLRRLPFLIENLKTDPMEWRRRNQAAMKNLTVSDNLKIYWLLHKHQSEIIEAFDAALRGPNRQPRFEGYQRVSAEEQDWNHRQMMQQLLHAIRTGEKSIFMSYCRDLAERRFSQGFTADEFCGALELLNLICMRVLRRDPDSKDLRQHIIDYLTMTLRFGCDQAQEIFEHMDGRRRRAPQNAAV